MAKKYNITQVENHVLSICLIKKINQILKNLSITLLLEFSGFVNQTPPLFF